jgi:hypothetical protein
VEAGEYTAVIYPATAMAFADPTIGTIAQEITGAGGASSPEAIADAVAQRLGSSTIEVKSPVITHSLIEIVRGDDYLIDDGRALSWTIDPYNGPSLTGATVTFTARRKGKPSEAISVAGGIVFAPGLAIFTVELTKADTNDLRPGIMAYDFDLEVNAANGSRITKIIGDMTVLADVTRP